MQLADYHAKCFAYESTDRRPGDVHNVPGDLVVIDEAHRLPLKKIPRQVLPGCEWGHGDCSLSAENLAQKLPEPGQQGLGLD